MTSIATPRVLAALTGLLCSRLCAPIPRSQVGAAIVDCVACARMAAITVTGATLAPRAAVVLFPTHASSAAALTRKDGRQYDVAPDGRFLINTLLDSAAAPARVHELESRREEVTPAIGPPSRQGIFYMPAEFLEPDRRQSRVIPSLRPSNPYNPRQIPWRSLPAPASVRTKSRALWRGRYGRGVPRARHEARIVTSRSRCFPILSPPIRSASHASA